MNKRILHIATRKSPLALWQAEYVRKRLMEQWPELEIELLPMTTSGDQFLSGRLQETGGKGLFVKELEEALLDGRADLAVHSMKDVPACLPDRLIIPTICQRSNPLDALVSQHYPHIHSLPQGAKIGTSSLRRQSQLLFLRPDLTMVVLRGNIQTRIQKMHDENLDAIILAAAGLERMHMQNHIREVLSPDIMLPSCGQGALGIECRKDDLDMLDWLAPLNHQQTSTCVLAERTVNALLGGGCSVPLAVYCQDLGDNRLSIQAKIFSIDGKSSIAAIESAPVNESQEMASRCADSLLQKGGLSLLQKKHE